MSVTSWLRRSYLCALGVSINWGITDSAGCAPQVVPTMCTLSNEATHLRSEYLKRRRSSIPALRSRRPLAITCAHAGHLRRDRHRCGRRRTRCNARAARRRTSRRRARGARSHRRARVHVLRSRVAPRRAGRGVHSRRERADVGTSCASSASAPSTSSRCCMSEGSSMAGWSSRRSSSRAPISRSRSGCAARRKSGWRLTRTRMPRSRT